MASDPTVSLLKSGIKYYYNVRHSTTCTSHRTETCSQMSSLMALRRYWTLFDLPIAAIQTYLVLKAKIHKKRNRSYQEENVYHLIMDTTET